jgi:hypothetical protein
MILLLPPKNERERSVKDFGACIVDNQSAMQRHCPIIVLSAALMGTNATDDIATISSLYAPVFNFTHTHAMSHSSDFFLACRSKVDI